MIKLNYRFLSNYQSKYQKSHYLSHFSFHCSFTANIIDFACLAFTLCADGFFVFGLDHPLPEFDRSIDMRLCIYNFDEILIDLQLGIYDPTM